jgi:four helix bundle protein
MEGYKRLKVWQKADQFAYEVYKITKPFPKEEAFGLTAQLRRAALAIPTNIVEGYSRRGDRELGRFLNMAFGSLCEAKYFIQFAARLGYIEQKKIKQIQVSGDELGRLLWGFYARVRSEIT